MFEKRRIVWQIGFERRRLAIERVQIKTMTPVPFAFALGTLERTLPNRAMKFFESGPLGRWPHRFTFVEDLGCGFSLLGFVVFLVVEAVLLQVFF
jgi:hypothetical protein